MKARDQSPLIVGLTGGIGAGKSSVSARLSELGACVIDSDIESRAVVEPGSEGLKAVRQLFGEAVLVEDGTLDRSKLAELVFGDPESLSRLNSVLHPLIEVRMKERLEECTRLGCKVVVLVVPLLFETSARLRYAMDKVVVVDLEESEAVKRVVSSRQISEAQVWERISRQMSRDERISKADYVIDNGSGIDSLNEQVDALWRELTAIAG